jgi:hypothetical protein
MICRYSMLPCTETVGYWPVASHCTLLVALEMETSGSSTTSWSSETRPLANGWTKCTKEFHNMQYPHSHTLGVYTVCNMYTCYIYIYVVLLGMIWDDIQGTVLVAWKDASNNDHLDVPKCKHLANLALAKYRGTRQQGRPSMSSLDFAARPILIKHDKAFHNLGGRDTLKLDQFLYL